ncbi:MAG: hypothetical protein PHS42_04690, partial [Sulfurimonas sp.]|nr:hypothetical protein [Sulfurimonas sp.]
AGIAAVSTVPVFGTAAAVGLGAVQIATDAMGITGGHKSPAPSYAQNAFSTPSGFNTMQAMNGGFGSNPKSAYNDTTNVANSIAGEYKANTAQESLDKTADVALGTEFIQDSVEGMNQTIQRLMDSGLYGGNK